MKIYYIVKEINKIPSCQYNILMLKALGYDVIPVFGRTTNEIKFILEKSHIYPVVLNNSVGRSYKFILKFRKFVVKYLNNNYCKEDMIFIGTVDTAVCLAGILKKYRTVLCVKELYDHDTYFYKKILFKVTREATTVVACEINRARYMKSEWKLSQMPFVLSNRPFYQELPRKSFGSTKETKEIIEQVEGKKAIIYQANHIHYAKELINLAKALRQINDNYVLVLIGNVDNDEDIKRIKSIYNQVLCTGYIKSPLHMEITSNGYIGITVYQENSLNNLFCAPNKIYEYACYGIPTLANDVPGLINTVALAQSGVCVNWNSVENLINAINKISDNYDFYQDKAIEFYCNSDNLGRIKEIVEYTKNVKEKRK